MITIKVIKPSYMVSIGNQVIKYANNNQIKFLVMG